MDNGFRLNVSDIELKWEDFDFMNDIHIFSCIIECIFVFNREPIYIKKYDIYFTPTTLWSIVATKERNRKYIEINLDENSMKDYDKTTNEFKEMSMKFIRLELNKRLDKCLGIKGDSE